jgi:hypothetical protein
LAAALTPQQRAHQLARARRARVAAELGPGPSPPPAPKGLYIHGSVGSGKTAIMDLFFEAAAPPAAARGSQVDGSDAAAAAAAAAPRLEFARRWAGLGGTSARSPRRGAAFFGCGLSEHEPPLQGWQRRRQLPPTPCPCNSIGCTSTQQCSTCTAASTC